MTGANADKGGSRGFVLVRIHLDIQKARELAGLSDFRTARRVGALHRGAIVTPPAEYSAESSRGLGIEICMAQSLKDRGHERQTGVDGADKWLKTGYKGGQPSGFGEVMGIVVDCSNDSDQRERTDSGSCKPLYGLICRSWKELTWCPSQRLC